jgi:hypothetical protein
MKTKIIRVPVPETRDPFVNTPLISLGKDEHGEERFWISTWNSVNGSLAALITESGRTTIYKGLWKQGGFYSAVPEDADTLWLCCDFCHVGRLDLRSRNYQEFPTGAPHTLMFQGMILDRQTGKLFAAAYPGGTTRAFSFDTRTRKPVKQFENVCEEKYMTHSFPNRDGTWSFVLHCPGVTIGRWDPRTDTVDAMQIKEQIDIEDAAGGTVYTLVADDEGRRYISGRGWFDPVARSFTPQTPPPSKEMTWFARRGRQTWGISFEGSQSRVGRWDMDSGAVKDLCVIPDSHIQNVALTISGKIVAVSVYGEFMRFDAQTGAIELSRRLPSDAVGATDCVCRIDKNRLLGTPFITQRFWEVDLRTMKGIDCGRAAPGVGEILLTWKIRNKIYMAAYTGGELVEYDPSQPVRFPENPCVVADPPNGMRPVASAHDGRRLFYACSHPYGTLGSTVTRYDTRTGETLYRDNPIPDQQVASLLYDRATDSLFCGTTMSADCGSAKPSSDRCFWARLKADDLSVVAKAEAPTGVETACIAGPMGKGRCLAMCWGSWEGRREWRWFVLDANRWQAPDVAEMMCLPEGLWTVVSTGKPGRFVLGGNESWELWDMPKQRPIKKLFKGKGVHKCCVQDNSVYFIRNREIIVLDNCLP